MNVIPCLVRTIEEDYELGSGSKHVPRLPCFWNDVRTIASFKNERLILLARNHIIAVAHDLSIIFKDNPAEQYSLKSRSSGQ